MPKKTPLYDAHIAAGARMVDFGGWEMPIAYGSQIEEHHQVRRAAGMFDVSHMTAVDLRGGRTREFLSRLLANDVARLRQPGKALYSCMLNEEGGVIDDLIVYFLDESHFRMVVNAATTDKDLEWLTQHAEAHAVSLTPRRDVAMVAVQGPAARAAVLGMFAEEEAAQAGALKPFFAGQFGELFIARTGYTGEDGFEVTVPDDEAAGFWARMLEAGVRPCGLGARDTLRLEAGMNLYGQDMDETTSPLEAGLGWTVAMRDDRDFIGRQALERQQARGLEWAFSGFVLEARGVLRAGQKLVTDAGEGRLTSGSFSPTLQRAIGMGRVPVDAAGPCRVEVRGKLLDVRMVRPPFVRNGTVCEGIIQTGI
jgi:aminomethyltransferase